MDLFSLIARLTLDKSQYEQGINDASNDADSFASRMKKGMGTAAKVGGAAMAAVGTAAVATTKALISGANETAQYGDQIDKMSQKLGISANAYQEWDAILQHSGSSIDSMLPAMKTMSNAAASGSDAFEKLGISQKQAASMSREDLFAQTITALQNVTDENERARLAQELFGRSAMELGPLLNTSAEETEAMRQRVHDLGGVMSDEAVKASAQFQDNLQDMKTAMSGVKRSIFQEFIPGLSSLMSAFTKILAGEDAGEALEQAIDSVVTGMGNVIDRLVQIGERIVPALVDGLVKAAPKLLEGAAQLVLALTQAIIENLPMLVQAGLDIIVTLARGIADSLPELIPTIVDVVLEIVDILTEPDTLANLVDAALQIIIALSEGMIKAAPKVIAKVPVIIGNLVDALIKSAPKLLEAGIQLIGNVAKGLVNGIGSVLSAITNIGKQIWNGFTNIGRNAWEWGKDLITNFTEGIKAFISKPIDAVKGLLGKIKRFIGFSEPEEGPLSDFHTYAPDMVKLFAQGIEDNSGLVTRAIANTFALPSMQSAGGGQPYVVPHGNATPRSIIVPLYIDGREFARAEVPYFEAEQRRVGMKLAGVNV